MRDNSVTFPYWILAILFVISLFGNPVLAVTLSLTGASGTDGADGLPGDPGGNGADGATGGLAAVVADVSADSANTATATGGIGGAGGDGGFGSPIGADGGNGGNGGAGGIAEVGATTDIAEFVGNATATATGGAGNDGGFWGTAGGGGIDGSGGNGGQGGGAVATASATALGDAAALLDAAAFIETDGTPFYAINLPSNSIISTATATGGVGGGGKGVGQKGGDGGIASATANASATLDAALIVVSARQRGGDGGSGVGGNGADGGNGANSIMNNAVSGSTNGGGILLEQRAKGGNGGVSGAIGNAGNAGDATSNLTYISTDPQASVNVSSVAIGGNGGDGNGSITGGTATANAEATGAGIYAASLKIGTSFDGISAVAIAVGGDGGNAGDGGTATATAFAVSTAGEKATARAVQNGGRGGDGVGPTDGGNGGDSIMLNPVSGSTSGVLLLNVNNIGGNGGDGGDVIIGTDGNGGNGGNASVFINESNPGGGDLVIDVLAGAGSGGNGAQGGDAGSLTVDVTGVGTGTANVAIDVVERGGLGNGGISSDPANQQGMNSVVSMSARGVSDMGDVTVSAKQRHSTMVDVVSGSTSGTLTLIQSKIGGAGPRISSLTAANPGGGNLVGVSEVKTTGGSAINTPKDSIASINLTGSADVTATAEAQVGNSNIELGAPLLGEVMATSTAGGTVDVTGRITAGSAHSIGNGGDATLIDAVDGSTSGVLILRQQAKAGRGSSFISGTEGLGGAAFSSLTRVENTAADVTIISEARAGRSAGLKTTGTLGGSAEAIANATSNSGAVKAETFALGGDSTDDGGLAVSNATASSNGNDHTVTVNGVAQGGLGAWNSADGNGGNATSVSTGTANGKSQVGINDSALGGQLINIFSAGNGGNATSTAIGSNAGDRDVIVTSTATGGTGTNGGLNGTASAKATAITSGSGNAQATATANGRSGNATADALSSGGLVTSIQAHTSTNVASTSTAESRASVGQAPDPVLAAGLQASAFGTGLPGVADSTAALAGNMNVAQNFDVGGASDVLGLVVLGGAYSANGSGVTHTYSSSVDFDIDMLQLDSRQNLLIGLLDSDFTGIGFDSLSFRIDMEGSTVVDELFTDIGTATSYFDDNTLDLGLWDGALAGDLDITFWFDMTTNDLGAGFSTSLIFGNSTPGIGVVPVPGAAWLFGTGLLGMVGLARRKS